MLEDFPFSPGKIEVVTDHIDELIYELACLTDAWQRNRDRGRASPILRKAIIQAGADLWDAVEFMAAREKAGPG
jgi:hypothetical protein